MKLDDREKLLFLPGFLTRNSFCGLAARVHEVLSRTLVDNAEEERMSYWQLVFLQSKVNGCSYRDEALPHAKWHWPRDTWFQEKLGHRLKLRELAGPQRGTNINSWLRRPRHKRFGDRQMNEGKLKP